MVPEYVLKRVSHLSRCQGQAAAIGTDEQVNVVVADEFLYQPANLAFITLIILHYERHRQSSPFTLQEKTTSHIHIAHIAFESFKHLATKKSIATTEGNGDTERYMSPGHRVSPLQRKNGKREKGKSNFLFYVLRFTCYCL